MTSIYLASSWRNEEQPFYVAALRKDGHEVYDFRTQNAAFGWEQLDSKYQNWSADEYIAALSHPLAEVGFENDFSAMVRADTGVLLLPCGRSAHLELGWMAGQGKRTVIVTKDGEEPELMAKMADHVCVGMVELLKVLHDG